jgi:hypothetical protein
MSVTLADVTSSLSVSQVDNHRHSCANPIFLLQFQPIITSAYFIYPRFVYDISGQRSADISVEEYDYAQSV